MSLTKTLSLHKLYLWPTRTRLRLISVGLIMSQTAMLRSLLHVTIIPFLKLKLRWRTASQWWIRVFTISPVSTSQTLTVLSEDPDMITCAGSKYYYQCQWRKRNTFLPYHHIGGRAQIPYALSTPCCIAEKEKNILQIFRTCVTLVKQKHFIQWIGHWCFIALFSALIPLITESINTNFCCGPIWFIECHKTNVQRQRAPFQQSSTNSNTNRKLCQHHHHEHLHFSCYL